jgi:hypothetical protein
MNPQDLELYPETLSHTPEYLQNIVLQRSEMGDFAEDIVMEKSSSREETAHHD